MPALPSSIIEPIWGQFAALIPPIIDTHPLRCHRPRIADRIIFDKLIQVLVLGASYTKISDSTCSATTLRTRRDEWITTGIFEQLEQICLEFYDRIIGLDLENLSVDGCIVKAPCSGEVAGRSPVDRENKEPNALSWSTGTASRSGAWWREPTAMTRRCCAPPWTSSAGSSSICLRRSRCIWMPVITRRRRGACWKNLVVTG